MTGITFFKTEHWILKLIYSIGLIAFLFHLYYFLGGNEDEQLIIPLIAYTSMTIFFLRLAFSQLKRTNSNK